MLLQLLIFLLLSICQMGNVLLHILSTQIGIFVWLKTTTEKVQEVPTLNLFLSRINRNAATLFVFNKII